MREMEDKRVLIADDDVDFRSALGRIIESWGYQVVSANHGMDAWQVLLREDAPRLMVLDWLMPGMDGLEICRRLRQRPVSHYTYIIMLTIRDEIEKLTEGLRAGADDYLTKPFVPDELQARLLAGRRVLAREWRLQQDLRDLQIQALHDPLTGIWNREGILRILSREVARIARNPGPLAVAMLDLDHFKLVNDTYGHLAGDRLLRFVTHKLVRNLRAYDALGRMGGDEFLIVLPDCTGDSALRLANRLRHAVGLVSVSKGEEAVSVTASLGITSVSSGIGVGAQDLIWAADQALLKAKSGGRNRVQMSSVQPTPTAVG
jgi:diguanylate cyclase (GGDEF)-like protein